MSTFQTFTLWYHLVKITSKFIYGFRIIYYYYITYRKNYCCRKNFKYLSKSINLSKCSYLAIEFSLNVIFNI